MNQRDIVAWEAISEKGKKLKQGLQREPSPQPFPGQS